MKDDHASTKLRRPLWVAGLVLLLVGGTWFVASRQQSPEQAAANARPPRDTPVLVSVELRRLDKTLVFRCAPRASYHVAVDVPVLPGDYLPIITAIGTSGTVAEGTVLLEVSHRPVFALAGALPAYRTLGPGDFGPDVKQLQRALVRLGLKPETNGRYGLMTQASVRRLYERRGYSPRFENPEPPEGATVPLGEVVFLPSFPAYAKILVNKAQRVTNGPLAEISGGRVDVVGTVAEADTEALKPRMSVRISDDLAGTSFTGTIRSLGATKQIETGRGRDVVIASSKSIDPGLLGADLRCTSVVASTGDSALVVPITAILSDPSGQTYVQVWRDGTTRRVMVATGLSNTTHVEIRPLSSGSLSPGDEVIVGATD